MADLKIEQDLTTCDLEAIQFLGCIQPHAFLIEVSADWLVTRVSTNIADFMPVTPETVLGQPASDILGHDAIHEVRGQLQISQAEHFVHRLYDLTIGGERFDFSLSSLRETTIIEGERHIEGGEELSAVVQPLIMQLRQVDQLDRLCALAARQVRALSGFDRVMIYRFHIDGSGEVIAETKRAEMPSFKGLRYPASDIPKQARLLYLRNPIRLIADVDAKTAQVVPAIDPAGTPLDLSLAGSRAVSSLHVEYLRNMGVAASLSVSIIVGGKLWGLIACHHRVARLPSLQARSAIEFFGHVLSTIFEGQLYAETADRQARARALHTTILNALGHGNATLEDIFPHLRTIQQLIRADGFAIFVDGRLRLSGTTPDNQQALDMMQFLNRVVASRVYSTRMLSSVYPEAADFSDVASGLLAVPVSRKPRDFVVFFRRELIHSVVWAGDPAKSVIVTDEGRRIGPRRSFESWRETVTMQSADWTDGELELGEALRVTLIEMMLQITDRAEKQRKISNDQQDLLIAELNHRVRNILNLIVGLVRQSSEGATDVASLASGISARVYALARAHDQLTSSGWGARSLSNMIRVEGAAYLGERIDRVNIHGSDAYIQPDAFATIALVMHELMTNAMKYGALADSTGSVEIRLERVDGAIVIDWREVGGGPVAEPTRRGFGSTIIERAIPHELSGTSQIRFDPDGLRATLMIPATYVVDSRPEEVAEHATVVPDLPALDRIEGSVLLVEDNLLIALETEDTLCALGADDVHIASTVAAALAFLRDSRPGFAVLDYNLGREQSVPIAEHLEAMKVPFAFATGYGDTKVIDDRFRGRPIIAKPYTARSLLDAFNAAIAHGRRASQQRGPSKLGEPEREPVPAGTP